MIDWDKAVLAPVMAVFGEQVTYMPAGGAPFMITGVFDAQYKGVDFAGGMDVQTDMPVLGIRLAEFPVIPRQKDQLRIERTGELFAVREVQPDGHGAAKLLLNGA